MSDGKKQGGSSGRRPPGPAGLGGIHDAVRREAAADPYVHGADRMHSGMPPEVAAKMHQRMSSFVPKITTGAARAEDFFDGILPEGANLAPGAGKGYREALQKSAKVGKREAASGGFSGTISDSSSGGSFSTTQRPYQPEFESPDRQQYPVHRNLANIYWRLFYKLDPIIGNGVDMFSELAWGNFELVGEGVDGEIKDTLELMCETTQVRAMLPYFVKEYLVLGEACPHLFYDEDASIWSYIGMHNPDQLEVIYTPFVKMDPIVRFKPDMRLRQVLTSQHQMTTALRESMPAELLNALTSGQHIELSPTNFTFIARKMHPYDVRGTSILSRMWRALMYEDAIFNASIATARRHAGPIKIAKLGDRNTGWIPDPSHERKLLELLAQAEIDVNAWIVYHYGVEFDMVGTTDRVMTIDRHWELIERIKLIALGISKAFLHGEVTYASAASGLTVFLQRLKALREFFENTWIYPKFFRPISVMNAWVKPTQAELAHKVRTRRSHRELLEDNRYIVPRLEWDRQLDPSVDQAQINAIQALTQMGIRFSKQTLSSLVGRDWEEELNQLARETKIEQKVLEENPDLMYAQGPGGEGGAPGGMPGGGIGDPNGIVPGLPDEALGIEPGTDGPDMGGTPEPGGEETAGIHAGEGDEGGPGREGDDAEDPEKSAILADFRRLLAGDLPEEEVFVNLWAHMEETGTVQQLEDLLLAHDPGAVDLIEDWLLDIGGPVARVRAIVSSMKHILNEETFSDERSAKLLQWEREMAEESVNWGGSGLLVGKGTPPRR